MRPTKHPVVYIGACEYEILVARTKKEAEKYLGKPKDHGALRWVTRAKCFADEKRIVLDRNVKSPQDRYEILAHEALHAICFEHAENEALCNLNSDEDAIAIVSKAMVSFMRQIRDNGVLDQ